MNIKMLKTRQGSHNGYTIHTYAAGETYDMGKTEGHLELAKVFLNAHDAQIVENQSRPVPADLPLAEHQQPAADQQPEPVKPVKPAKKRGGNK